MLRNPLDPKFAKQEIITATPFLKWSQKRVSLPRLFKQTKTGKTQVWDIYTELVNSENTVSNIKKELLTKRLPVKWYSVMTVQFGQKDGKIQSAPVEITEGKNIGRTNETNVLSQGIQEMISEWTKQQKRKGYHQTEADITIIRAKPMLLDKYENFKHYIDFSKDVYVQEKLDGVRVMVHWDPQRNEWIITSREGTEYCYLNHIRKELDKLTFLKQHPNVYLDGELFSREVNFNKIVSLCRKTKTITPKELDEQKYIKMFVYDMVDLDNIKVPFRNRIKFVNKILGLTPKGTYKNKYLVPVPTYLVKNDEEVQKHHAKYVEYSEGTVIRQGEAPYLLGKRSKYALKLKDFEDGEFIITGFLDGKGKEKGLIRFILETPDGKEFTAVPNMPHDERRKMFKQRDSYIGKKATVKYFEITPDGLPRFGKVIAIRDYE